ncbi:MAG: hypothetical protein WAN93_12450 [Solirubrobacteraceae bacterium]
MSGEFATDFPTVAALVRLRMLAEDARRRAIDTSDAGRHIALIALDGACEYALWLAARTHGVPFKEDRPSLAVQYHALKAALNKPRWEARGWSAVEQLHRARNDAQHAAVAADPAQLPVWSDAVWAFIDSLCQAAFRVRLDKILLADAVRDSELRNYLRWSEEALSVERGRAFKLALEAFDRARGRWRAQHEMLEFTPPPGGPLVRPNPLQGVQGKFQQLDALLEVQPFANDIGEYFWLRRARQEFEAARWPPSHDDERRALLFVVNWIVRWEIFDRGYPDNDWEAHRESIGPPVVDDGIKTEIRGSHTDLLPEVAGRGGRRVAVYLQLVNVPGRGRAPWGEVLQQALADSAQGSGAPGLFAHFGWDIEGMLELHIPLASDPDSLGLIVHRAVDLAVERYQERVIQTEYDEQERQEIEAAFDQLFVSARSDLAFFSGVSIVRDDWMNTGGWIVFIHLKEGVAGGEEITQALDIFRDAARTLQKLHLREGCIAFQACELTEGIEREIRLAVERSEDQVRHLREIRATQGQTFKELFTSIQQQFGELPAD